jgi:hypothetical protein
MDELSSMTYYGMAPGKRRKLQMAIAIMVALVFLGIASGILSGNRALLIGACTLSLAVCPLCIGLMRHLQYARLGVGENGLKVRGGFGSDELEIAWEAVERLHFDAHHQGIVMREPFDHPVTQGMIRGAQVRLQSASGAEKIQVELVANQRWIPFENFAGWFDGGSIVEEFRRFAPGLAEDYDRVSGEFSKVLERQRIALMVGCSAAVVSLLALVVAILFSGIVDPTGHAITWGNFLQIVASVTLSILSLLLVPLLGYFAFSNLIAALGEWKQGDLGAAITCVFLSILQAGFAFWIVSSIVFTKRA